MELLSEFLEIAQFVKFGDGFNGREHINRQNDQQRSSFCLDVWEPLPNTTSITQLGSNAHQDEIHLYDSKEWTSVQNKIRICPNCIIKENLTHDQWVNPDSFQGSDTERRILQSFTGELASGSYEAEIITKESCHGKEMIRETK